MGTYGGPNIIRDGVIFAIDAANPKSYPGTGTTWYDLSGGGADLTLYDGPTYSSDYGGIITFDGVNDSSVKAGLNISELTGITVNVWFYANANSSMALTRGTSNSFLLHFRGAGFYVVDDIGTPSGYLSWDAYPPDGEWVMLTGTWDGSTMKLYTNGVKQSTERSFTGTGTLRTITLIQAGYYFNGSQGYTNGSIAHQLLYNRALTDDEIIQNYLAIRSRFV